MPRKNLTTRFVESIEVDTRTDFWDDHVRGLVLRASPTGVKAWTAVYTRESDGAKQRVTLGKFPAMPLEKARARALATMAAVGDGKDPAGSKRARREAMTVRELGELFMEKYSKRNKRSWAEDQRHLNIDIYPFIGGMRALTVKRRDILDIIDAKADAGHLAASRHVLAVLRKMFGWAVGEGYLGDDVTSPCAGVRPRGKVVSRDRVLSDDEVKAIWNALPEAGLSLTMADIIRLLFLTGQRSGEVCGMRRSEIDLDEALWTLPRERVKNDQAHTVPLSATAMGIIKARLAKIDEERDAPLFSKIGDPIESNAVSQAVRKKLQLLEKQWTPHDARRTVATGMAKLKIAPHEIEATLNHKSGFKGGVAGTYNLHEYDDEKRKALGRWEKHLAGVIAGKPANVTPIRRALERA